MEWLSKKETKNKWESHTVKAQPVHHFRTVLSASIICKERNVFFLINQDNVIK